MTPDEYIAHLRETADVGKHAEALAFADAHRDVLDPPLTPYQQWLVAETLHVSSMIEAMEEYAARREAEQADAA